MKRAIQKDIISDENLIAYCGLYCGACRSCLSEKCPGCKDNVKASWCKVRQCCIENGFMNCANCETVALGECKKYNSFLSKAVGFILNSDRSACIKRIRETGNVDFASEMAHHKRMTIRRK